MTEVRKHITKYRVTVAGLASLGFFYTLAATLSTVFLGQLTQQMAGGVYSGLWRTAIYAGAAAAAQIALEFLYNYRRELFASRAEAELRARAADSLAACPGEWIESRGGGDILGRTQTELEESAEALCRTVPDIIQSGMGMIICAGVMMVCGGRLAFIYLAAIIFVVIVQSRLSSPAGKLAQDVAQSRGKALSFIRDAIARRQTVRAYNAHMAVLGWLERLLEPWRSQELRMELMTSPLRTVGWMLGVLPSFAMCIGGAMMVRAGELSLGGFMTAYFLADTVLNAGMHYIDKFILLRRGRAGAERLAELLGAPAETEQRTAGTEGAVTLRDVYYTYPGAEVPALKGISLHLEPGEKAAFVGPSGCGKSTVLRLMTSLAAPDSGEVSVSGAVGYVSQNPYIFAGTVGENIDLGRGLDKEELKSAAERSGAMEFIERLPGGFEEVIGEGGRALSPGQAQRLAIARAFAGKCRIMVMDEAASALDAEGERRVLSAVAGLRGVTVAYVTHRLGGLEDFDRIFVMRDGVIAEQGSHEELLAAGGLYAALRDASDRG